jgi:hypothetical protein
MDGPDPSGTEGVGVHVHGHQGILCWALHSGPERAPSICAVGAFSLRRKRRTGANSNEGLSFHGSRPGGRAGTG